MMPSGGKSTASEKLSTSSINLKRSETVPSVKTQRKLGTRGFTSSTKSVRKWMKAKTNKLNTTISKNSTQDCSLVLKKAFSKIFKRSSSGKTIVASERVW
jgi:hypothetical protein